jgi:hypothetical protein
MDLDLFKAGEMPREQLRMPSEAYIQIDQWIDYLGPETYIWWRKFISWVNRQPSRLYDFHVPYTLESVYEKHLKVSKATFYRKIKALWESGLIELVEFDKSERKTTKPRNIIVYNYPFNKKEFEYLPLEKRRDWAEEYESQAKEHGYKGVLKAREIRGLKNETVGEVVDNSPEIVDNPVDNPIVDSVDNFEVEGLRNETVEGLKFETVRVSEMRPNHYLNNLIIKNNNYINNYNNSLSNARIDLIREILINYQFSEGERERIVELLIHKGLYSQITKHDLLSQAKYMISRNDIRDRATFFVNGIEKNIGREYPKPRPKKEEQPNSGQVPFYNWLEQ